MLSDWHNITRGIFKIDENVLLLDYRSNFLDGDKLARTLYHEQTHHILFQTTDFGLATLFASQIYPNVKPEHQKAFDLLFSFLTKSQYYVQESTATFMSMLHLRNSIGPRKALQKRTNILSGNYLDFFNNLIPLFNKSKKYRTLFTSKIPSIALEFGFRKIIVEMGLLDNLESFKSYIQKDGNIPDKRFKLLLTQVIENPTLLKKSTTEIARYSGLHFGPALSKKEVANFLNYLLKFTTSNYIYKEADINDCKSIDQLNDITGKLLISNLNINIANNSEVLLKAKDLLHYEDIISIVTCRIINESELSEETKSITEEMLGKKYEASLLAITETGEKYIHPSSINDISDLLNNHFQNATIINKFGLYNTGSGYLLEFQINRKPNIILYRYPDDFIKTHENEKINFKYLKLEATIGNHLTTLLVIDDWGVVHLINHFPKGINDILARYSARMENTNKETFEEYRDHINNAFYFWMGLPKSFDWFEGIGNSSD